MHDGTRPTHACDDSHLRPPVPLGVLDKPGHVLDGLPLAAQRRRGVEVDLQRRSTDTREHLRHGATTDARCAAPTLCVTSFARMRAHGESPVRLRGWTGCSFSHSRMMSHKKAGGASVLMAVGEVWDWDT